MVIGYAPSAISHLLSAIRYSLQHSIRRNDCLRDFAQFLVFVLAAPLHPAKCFLLRQVQAAHQNSLGALDQFAGLQRIAQVVHLAVQCLELLETRDGECNRREQILFGNRLHQVRRDIRIRRALC